MRKRMSKVICKLRVLRTTGTWQLGVSGICCLSSEKTQWMFKHKQSPSFNKVCTDQSVDALWPVLVGVNEPLSMPVGTAEADASLPVMPVRLLWPWSEKPERGVAMEEGETTQQWGLLVLPLLGAQRSQATCTGSKRSYFALFSFCLSPAVASPCQSSPAWHGRPLAQPK